MSQPTVTDFWKSYTGLLGNDINRKFGYSSKIISMFGANRKEWLEESGFNLKHVQFERAGITADADADFTDDDNAAFPEAIKSNAAANYGGSSTGGAYDGANNVDPPTDTLTIDKVERSFVRVQKAINSEDMTIEDLRAAAQSDRQVASLVGVLADTAKEDFVRMYRDDLVRVGKHRFIVKGSSDNPIFEENTTALQCFTQFDANRWNAYGLGDGTFDVSAAIDAPNKQTISTLTWAHLDELYERMLHETGEAYTDMFSDGQPVFVLLTDLQTKNSLLTEGTLNGSDIRTDIRENASAVGDLLKPMGVSISYRGWAIVPEAFGRRFEIDGDTTSDDTGDWNEHLVYTNSGRKRILNSSYTSAKCGESYAFAPNAWCNFASRPSYTGKGAMTFTPQNYAGDWSFNVQREKARNPDGAHGYFRAKLESATVAEEPELIYTLRHLRGNQTYT